MKKEILMALALLLFIFPASGRDTVSIQVLPKNAVTFNLGGSGFIYSLGYERQTRPMGMFNLYAKVSGYIVPFEPLLFHYKQMGGSAELGFKLGEVNHKFAFGLGVATAYHYRSDFQPSFPVADGSFRYKAMFAYICNMTYQYYSKNGKWRFESGGTIVLPHKEKFDASNTCGSNDNFALNEPIPWLTLGLAYTF